MSGATDKDRELDAYLRGDSPLSQAYRKDARELPPAHVDAQILAEAHRADAGPRKPRASSPFSGSWMVPASVAAVLVLAVSVAVLLPQGRPGYERQRDRFEDSAAPDSRVPATDGIRQGELERSPEVEYAPPPPRTLDSEPAPAEAATKAAPSEPIAPAMERRPSLQKKSTPADPAQPEPDAARERSPRTRSVAPAATGPAAESGLSGGASSEAISGPDDWLRRIKRLIDQGQLETARESLVEFRRVYPTAEVPPEIIESLQQGEN